jgi:5'(3')-deoxyribonucleotidase
MNKLKQKLLDSVEDHQREMIDGIIEIVRKVEDLENRKVIAKDLLKDFKKEDISVEKTLFLDACGIKENFSIKSFDEFLLENNQSKLHFYIDMDGVLADFDGEVRDSKTGEAFEEALQNLRDWMQKNHPEIKWRIPHDLKAMAQNDPKLKALYQEVSNNVMKEATKKDFFRKLKILDGAREILETARELSGKLPDILTACVSSPYCEPEKREWMEKHFAGMYNKIYFEQNKEKYAKEKGDVLIDDRSRNVKKFVDAGGMGINHYEEDLQRTLKQMKELANEIH